MSSHKENLKHVEVVLYQIAGRSWKGGKETSSGNWNHSEVFAIGSWRKQRSCYVVPKYLTRNTLMNLCI